MDNKYESKFYPPDVGQDVLRSGQIIGVNEMPHEMVDRVVQTVAGIETKFGTAEKDIIEFAQKLGAYIDDQTIIFSTPVLTNAGRFKDRPLSACVVPPVDLRGDLSKVKEIVDEYHQDGMGTGFDLSDLAEPVSVLRFLNNVAIDGAGSGKEQRPVGNMATLHVSHPKILEFVNVKVGADDRKEKWKFNISVNVSDAFMQAVINNCEFSLEDGTMIHDPTLFRQMAESCQACGDPGIVFLDRMNAHNPTPFTGTYISTAPCAEVGLAPGESCQFGYINLGKFVRYNEDKTSYIDLEALADVSATLLRALDNALEISIDNYATVQSQSIMTMKRKVGVGICGYADLLIKMEIPYNTSKAREILLDIVNFININTKKASVELAKTRGAAPAVRSMGSKYAQKNGYLAERYGNLETPSVSSQEWIELDEEIYKTGQLRNATTIALPPTGRSGMVIGASTGVEPLFKLSDRYGVNPVVIEILRRYSLDYVGIVEQLYKEGKAVDVSDLPEDIRKVLVTATEISPIDHLLTVAEVQKAVDESISKTVNLPADSTPDNIVEIQILAYKLGLKGISVFRDHSRSYQPKEL